MHCCAGSDAGGSLTDSCQWNTDQEWSDEGIQYAEQPHEFQIAEPVLARIGDATASQQMNELELRTPPGESGRGRQRAAEAQELTATAVAAEQNCSIHDPSAPCAPMQRRTRAMTETSRDEVFRSRRAIGDFQFDQEVASVFDDMVTRSVPFYDEIQRMVRELSVDFAVPQTTLYDLGCSTGTTFLLLDPVLRDGVKFVGIDNSADMLAKCETRLKEHGIQRDFDLRCHDLHQGIAVDNASVVLMILTLQFIRPLHRDKLIADIYRGMNTNGCLILVEKVLGEDSLFNRLFINHYYDLKRRNGYSDLEISQKREALENVLVPYKLLENRELLLRVGFRYVDVFFKWYNFSAIIAVK